MAITLDLLMPGMDGWGALAAMKADEELKEIPIVVVTILDGTAGGASVVLGASEFLTKPVERKRLVQALSKFRSPATTADSGPILVVEDDEPTRELIRRTLSGEGWAVAEACDGRAATESVARQMPSAIVLDLMMPDMDGFEFISEFRKLAAAPGVPIIVLTAMNVTDEDRARLGGGVLSILAKGDGSREALIGQLRRILKGVAQARHQRK